MWTRPGRVSFETGERIRTIAAELGYRTRSLARALPTGHTSMIALVISDITNPFYNHIIQGAQVAASEAGYTILLTDTQESGAHERTALDRTVSTVEGIVLAAPLGAMGRTAVGNLLAIVRGARPRSQAPVSLPCRLVVRESTAHRRRSRTSPAWATTSVSGSAASRSRSTEAGSR